MKIKKIKRNFWQLTKEFKIITGFCHKQEPTYACSVQEPWRLALNEQNTMNLASNFWLNPAPNLKDQLRLHYTCKRVKLVKKVWHENCQEMTHNLQKMTLIMNHRFVWIKDLRIPFSLLDRIIDRLSVSNIHQTWYHQNCRSLQMGKMSMPKAGFRKFLSLKIYFPLLE